MTALRLKPDSPTLSIALPLSIIAALTATAAFQAGIIGSHTRPVASVDAPQTVVIPTGTFSYREDGEYFKNGYAVDAPMRTMTMNRALTIMKYQVSGSDYNRCVTDGACAAPEPGFTVALDVRTPATGISHDDAKAYAAWLSARTGEVWTLPSDAQLAFAAGSIFPDEKLDVDTDSTNPAARWLADYERQTSRKASRNPVPQSYGTFGENEHGLSDFGGNIWEWTATCSRRVNLDANGNVTSAVSSCGIPVASGKHRAALSGFVRNPKGGGCAVGVPPDNLGFRLVKDTRWYAPLAARLRNHGWSV